MAGQVPLVDYLVLGDEPHLVANECTACGARFFDRRNACASCSGTEFTHGRRSPPRASCARSRSCAFAAPGIAGAVRRRRRRLRRHQRARQPRSTSSPTPSTCTLGMKVRLATYSLGTDDDGTEAIGFGFEPID